MVLLRLRRLIAAGNSYIRGNPAAVLPNPALLSFQSFAFVTSRPIANFAS